MEELEMLKGILNSYPYPIVFVDNDYIIRFMNQNAQYHYYEERGYKNLIGKSLFDCHSNEKSIEGSKSPPTYLLTIIIGCSKFFYLSIYIFFSIFYHQSCRVYLCFTFFLRYHIKVYIVAFFSKKSCFSYFFS